MPFKFAWLCELFEQLQQQSAQQRATYSRQDDPVERAVVRWYDKYYDKIERCQTSSIAFLSALLPEHRPDRTYNLQDKRLTQLFGRILGLGTNRLRQLSAWQTPDGPDFAMCVQMVMAESEFAPPKSCNEVTVEEIDLALTRIAANSVSSAPDVREYANSDSPFQILKPIVIRLQGIEAKWLVRMILKSYSPVQIPEHIALYCFHFMLPKLLSIQNSFEAAVATLSSPELILLPPRPSKGYATALLPLAIKEIRPKFGVMIRRQPLDKARSIKHCLRMADNRVMSVERKYDGEYCQIHIDKRNASGRVQIFSKSGRDSTLDRFSLHGAIKAGLRLDSPDCKIRSHAILEGELVVYSRIHKSVLPFYHIRKHVRHGGKWIGTEADSPRRSGEQLMIVFFDVLMLDEKVMINEPHRTRRQYLKGLVSQIEGTATVVERALIDFKSRNSPQVLRKAFAAAIRQRWEGFVLKGLEDPYYSWKEGARSIKMKKDYIAGLGDTADLCVVGARRDARTELDLKLGKLTWTHFYIACLVNKAEFCRFGTKPLFTVIDRIGPGNMSKDDILVLNSEGRLVEQEFSFESAHVALTHSRKDIPPPSHMFTSPIVIELMGAGYERPQTVNFYTLRFPRIGTSNIKVHRDRSIADTVSFDELQAQAKKSMTEPEDFQSQEDAEWVEKLLAADPKPKYIVDKSQSTSPSKTPRSATTISITPGTAKYASTQPSPLLVRMDSEEMTSEEWHERYPNSMPQTPSRRSESTISPTTRDRTSCVKRRLTYAHGATVLTAQRKRQRVEFATDIDTERKATSMPLSELDNPPFIAKPRTNINFVTKQGKPDEEHEPVTSSSNSNSSEVAAAAGSRVARELLTDPFVIQHGNSPREAQNRNNKAHPFQTHEATSHSCPPQQHPGVDPRAVFETVIAPIMAVPYHVQVQHPILITSSVIKNTAASRNVRSFLRTHNVDYTLSTNNFLNISLSSRQLPLYAHRKCIILVDSDNTSEAATDLRRIAKCSTSNLSHEIEHWMKSDMLVFDYRVLLTNFAEWGLKLNFDFACEDERDNMRFDFSQCEQWFCGVLEFRAQTTEPAPIVGRSRTDIGVRMNLDLSAQQAFVTRSCEI